MLFLAGSLFTQSSSFTCRSDPIKTDEQQLLMAHRGSEERERRGSSRERTSRDDRRGEERERRFSEERMKADDRRMDDRMDDRRDEDGGGRRIDERRERDRDRDREHDRRRSPPGRKKNELCRDFRLGRCRRGSNCPFIHGEEEKNETCRDFLSAVGCSRGEMCPFIHPGKRSSSGEPCRDYLRGSCKRGSSCPYVHLPPRRDLGLLPSPFAAFSSYGTSVSAAKVSILTLQSTPNNHLSRHNSFLIQSYG